MAQIPIDRLRHWVAQLDPKDALLPGDPRYVDLDDLPGARRGDGAAAVDELLRTIMFAERGAATWQLFTGYPGSGKTTELRRLQERLSSGPDGAHVVWLDAEKYLDPFLPPTIVDLLRALAFALDREATAADGADPDAAPGYVERLWRWLQSDVELTQVSGSLSGAQLMAEIRANPTFRERVEKQLHQSFQAFATEAGAVVASALQTIRVARNVDRVVLLVDGLEKFRPLRPEDQELMERSVEAVFHQHAAFLTDIPCHVVYTFPYWLRWLTVGLGQAYSSTPVVLPMVKVGEPDGSPNGVGRAKVTELIGRRLDLVSVFGGEDASALRTIVAASGGYPRDVVRLVRDVLRAATDFPIGTDVVDKVVNRLAEEYELVALRADADVLAHIAGTRSLPEGEDGLRAAGRLIQLYLVLTYRNGGDWYDLHPLVRRSERIRKRLGPGG